MRVLALILLLPLFEIFTFVQVGGKIGGLWTILLTLGTAFFGVFLVKTQGLRTVNNVREQVQNGEMPGQAVASGVMLFVSGALLIVPGFLSDSLGLLLLLPFVRSAIAGSLIQGFVQKRANAGGFQQGPANTTSNSRNTIEGEYRREDD